MKILNCLLFIFISWTGLAQTMDYPAPGKLVDIGGYKIHLLVEGENRKGPTVIFFHGAGDIALIWNLVLPEVGRFARAVAIDQAGEGWSEHGHGMALNQQVFDSHKALKMAGMNPPYLVVGHSLGAILANLFAVEYKQETAGLVMVDGTHPDVVLKIFNKETKQMEWKKMRLTAKDTIPELIKTPLTMPHSLRSFQAKRDFGDRLVKFSAQDKNLFHWIYNERPWTYVKGQSNTYEAEIFQKMYDHYEQYSLEDLPLIVITGGKKKPPQGDENWSTAELTDHSRSLQLSLLKLSSNSSHVIASHSGHDIHIDEPEVVIEEIRKLVKAIKIASKK